MPGPGRLAAALLLVVALLALPAVPATAQTALACPTTGTAAIGAVQGEVAATADGDQHRSPCAPTTGNGNGQTVTVQGVIFAKTLARTSSGGSNYGFFVQNTAATDDDNRNTSDGIFVFHGRFTTLLRQGGGSYTPQVGDEVVLQGPVAEFFNLTQLVNPRLASVIRSGVNLDQEVPAFETSPPDDLAEAERYWERREGMRARVPAGSIIQNGRNVFPSTADGEVWVIRPDHPVARRSDPYARRVFRDPHPLDNKPEPLFDDGNGYRILMGSLGIKATSGTPPVGDNTALIAPARTFDTLINAPTGGVYFSFGKYAVQVEQQIALNRGPDPSRNAPPQAPVRAREYNVASFNVENLYDFRDDPNDGCDFAGNSGCPGVSPPFDYVPASDAAYRTRLGQIADQIIADLHAPDVVMIQEAEDQDICAVNGGALTCGATDKADDKPDTLQELAAAIKAKGGPAYEAVFDRDGADDRGIVSGYLYRTDRVELLPARPDDPVLGGSPRVQYRAPSLPYNTDVQNPKALNADLPADVDRSTGTDGDDVFTRAPQVGLFRVWRDGIGTSVFTDLYILNNHFSSTPDQRVGQRAEQAAYNSAIVDAIQGANPDARVIVGGDLNVYPRPDDPFNPPSDQLGSLYGQGLFNLWDRLVAEVPASAYSYVFQGQAQTLDQLFVSRLLRRELAEIRAAHVNADWPADYPDDGARGTSDHDPPVARFSNLPTLDRLIALIRYFIERGDISIDDNQARSLLERLERLEELLERNRGRADEGQTRALIGQLQGLGPDAIKPEAAETLRREAALLLEAERRGDDRRDEDERDDRLRADRRTDDRGSRRAAPPRPANVDEREEFDGRSGRRLGAPDADDSRDDESRRDS